MARAINPIHTLSDGDTVFAVSTGDGTPLAVNDPADSQQLNAVFNAGATTLSRAIAKAVLSAQSQGDRRSYCDTYPSACAEMGQLAEWRTAGAAADITPQSFRRAARALEQTPVPRPRRDRPTAPAAPGAAPVPGAAIDAQPAEEPGQGLVPASAGGPSDTGATLPAAWSAPGVLALALVGTAAVWVALAAATPGLRRRVRPLPG